MLVNMSSRFFLRCSGHLLFFFFIFIHVHTIKSNKINSTTLSTPGKNIGNPCQNYQSLNQMCCTSKSPDTLGPRHLKMYGDKDIIE